MNSSNKELLEITWSVPFNICWQVSIKYFKTLTTITFLIVFSRFNRSLTPVQSEEYFKVRQIYIELYKIFINVKLNIELDIEI